MKITSARWPFSSPNSDVPVYGTAFTLSLVERRLEEYDVDEPDA